MHYVSFDLYHNGTAVAFVRMGVQGMFNVVNVLAAIASADYLGVDPQKAA